MYTINYWKLKLGHLIQLCYSLMLPKRFEIFIKILAISALSFCLPVMAQEQNGWQFDSLVAESKRFQARCPAGL